MDNTYYRVWVGKVITFCWVAVVVQQVLAHATIIVDKFHLVRDVGKMVQAVRKRLKRAESQKIEAEYRKKTKGQTQSEKRHVKRRTNIYSQVRYALLRPRSYWNDPKDSEEAKKKKAEEYARLEHALAKSKELKKAYDLLMEFRDLPQDTKAHATGVKSGRGRKKAA